MKYIIAESEFEPILLIGNTKHEQLAKAVLGTIISAGQVKVVNGKIEVFGKSEALEVSSRPEDVEVVSRMFGLDVAPPTKEGA